MRNATALGLLLAVGCAREPEPQSPEGDAEELASAARAVDDERDREALALASRQSQQVREHTQQYRHCPGTAAKTFGVPLNGGPTFNQILETLEHAYSIQLAEPPVPLEGAHFYEAWSRDGGMHGWRSSCYVTEQRAYCSTSKPEALESLIADFGLARRPDSLEAIGWVRLLAEYAGGLPVSDLPALAGCLSLGADGSTPPTGTISLTATDASISMPILSNSLTASLSMTVLVEIHGGQAHVEYKIPPPETGPDVWEGRDFVPPDGIAPQ